MASLLFFISYMYHIWPNRIAEIKYATALKLLKK